jgi:hypothetical protein
MKAKPSLTLWKYMFEHLYVKHVGISWVSGGGDDEYLEKYYDMGYKPKEAVLHQMEKYDLVDVRQQKGGW